MQKLFFTAGPTHLYPSVEEHLKRAVQDHIPSISHRSKRFEQIFEKADKALRKLMGIPDQFKIFFMGAGTEAMERILQSCTAKQSFHFVNGAFSNKFFEISKQLGRAALCHQVPEGQGYDPSSIEIPLGVELICITHNETSTGVSIPERMIAGCKARNPDKLLCVDVVSSAPIVKLDFAAIDACFFSSQKCFGLPSGLGALIVNDACLNRARELQAQGKSVGTYHSLLELERYAKQFQTPATPNVLGIYLLGEVATDMLAVGIDRLRQESVAKAKQIFSSVESTAGLSLFAKDPFRSNTLIVVECGEKLAELQTRFKAAGIEVSSGYGKAKDFQLRIANFPALDQSALARLLSCFYSE